MRSEVVENRSSHGVPPVMRDAGRLQPAPFSARELLAAVLFSFIAPTVAMVVVVVQSGTELIGTEGAPSIPSGVTEGEG